MIPIDKITGRLGNKMFQFATIYSLAKDNNTDFYFQDPTWFSKYEQDIKTLFGEGIGYLDQVGIHVRRGDYVGNPFYVDLTQTDYYEKAIALFPHDNFLIFSDDPEFCKTLHWYDKDRFQIMEKNDEVDDLNLMASCKSQIIANSSYSFWAAYLNPNPAKRVITPKAWYSDGIERTKVPPEWTQI